MAMFGTAYQDAASVVRILAPMLLVRGVGDILCYQVLVSTGKEGKFLPVYILAAVINVGMNSILIPWMDYDGAAIASLASEVFLNGILLICSLKMVKPKLSKKFCGSVACGTGAMALVAAVICCVPMARGLRLILSVGTGVGVYMIMGLWMKNDVLVMLWQKVSNRMKRA